jgi:hypothetical protein
MPADPTILSTVSNGDVVSAENIRNRFQELENLVNGGIKKVDLKVGPDFTEKEKQIFNSRHIVKPEFYSIANTRIQGVSSDVFYRNTFDNSFNRYVRHEHLGYFDPDTMPEEGPAISDLNAVDANSWSPIDGMSSTVVVKGKINRNAFVNGSLYAFCAGGSDRFTGTTLKERHDDAGGKLELTTSTLQRQAFNRCKACLRYSVFFGLYVDTLDGSGPQLQNSTVRFLLNRGERSYPFRKQQISFSTRVTLTPGPNKLSYRSLYRIFGTQQQSLKHVFIDNRNFFVDVHYR